MTNMKNPNSYCCNALLLFGMICNLTFSLVAQPNPELSDKIPYYIDVNNANRYEAYDIQEGMLSLQYHDAFGQWSKIPLRIYNWKHELIANFELDKAFGLNNYSIDLKEKCSGLEIDKVYYCEIQDESGKKHKWSFKNMEAFKRDLSVNIIINPLHLSCDDPYGTLVEFYGQVQNGMPPFIVNWYVVNQGKTDFLYQPREEKVMKQGNTAAIQVDKSPAYHVVMDVTDACGANSKKMVLVECKGDKKRINTVFVEPVKLSPKSPGPSQ